MTVYPAPSCMTQNFAADYRNSVTTVIAVRKMGNPPNTNEVICLIQDINNATSNLAQQVYSCIHHHDQLMNTYRTTIDTLVKEQIEMAKKMEKMMNELEYLTNLEKKREEEYKRNEKMNTYLRLKKELQSLEAELKL